METEQNNGSAKLSYDEKKAQKIEKREAQKKSGEKKKTKKSIVRWTVLLIIIALVVWGLYAAAQRSESLGEDFSQTFSSDGRNHIEVGAAHKTYSSNPPSSGPHNFAPVRAGFYDIDEVVPDEAVIHNLEHGDIWIAYKPTISEADREILRTFAAAKVIVTPREANDFDVSLVAWGRVDGFDLTSGVLESRISDFIARYKNKGPERVATPIGAHRR